MEYVVVVNSQSYGGRKLPLVVYGTFYTDVAARTFAAKVNGEVVPFLSPIKENRGDTYGHI